MKLVPSFSMNFQRGALLLEAMVAIIIFTIGVLALIGVQAAVMRSSSDSKMRVEAELFVDQLFSEMTADARDIGQTPPFSGTSTSKPGQVDANRLVARYASAQNGPGYQRWRNRVIDVANGGLPDAAANLPTVVITDQSDVNQPKLVRVDAIVFWRTPSDPSTLPARRVVATTFITD